MYAAYTPYDKAMYIDTMGNFMYLGKGYKNEFVVKKDIRVPSDKQLVDNFIKVAKNNPERVSKDMSLAYNELHWFARKSEKQFYKKISDVSDTDIKKGEKLSKEYISLLVSDKTKASRSLFFGNLIREGFDAMSDVNDRDPNAGTQDPLIIFNPSKVLGGVKSVKLTNKDLDYYWKLSSDEKFLKTKDDLSNVQH
jgi:hypothetical protein